MQLDWKLCRVLQHPVEAELRPPSVILANSEAHLVRSASKGMAVHASSRSTSISHGMTVGGNVVGFSVGVVVGNGVGFSVGVSVGASVGVVVGNDVGTLVGNAAAFVGTGVALGAA
jgi:hypothetical protein